MKDFQNKTRKFQKTLKKEDKPDYATYYQFTQRNSVQDLAEKLNVGDIIEILKATLEVNNLSSAYLPEGSLNSSIVLFENEPLEDYRNFKDRAGNAAFPFKFTFQTK